MFIVETILSFLTIALPILIAIAYLTLAERKIMGSMQQRFGPNSVGFLGLMQPMADGLKLLLKESVIPSNSNTFSFIFAPILTFFLSLIGWSVIPFSTFGFFTNVDLSLMFLFAASSLGVYGIILSGWASNSKYAFFGAIRSAAQLISYEVSIGLILISILLSVGSLNFIDIVQFQNFVFFSTPFFPLLLMFLISILAETNRAPFDLPEAESELVSGFNVEYASMGFALFFLAEYGSIILMSVLTVVMFIGGWLFTPILFPLYPFFLGFKTCFILFFFYLGSRFFSKISCWPTNAIMLKDIFTTFIRFRYF